MLHRQSVFVGSQQHFDRAVEYGGDFLKIVNRERYFALHFPVEGCAADMGMFIQRFCADVELPLSVADLFGDGFPGRLAHAPILSISISRHADDLTTLSF